MRRSSRKWLMVWLAAILGSATRSTALEITTTNLPSGMEMVPYRASLAATNGMDPCRWSVLPVLSVFGGGAYQAAKLPPEAGDLKAIAAGEFCLGVTSAGTIVAWGDDEYTQANLPAGLSNVIAVAGGSGINLALKSDGTVVAWDTLFVPVACGQMVACQRMEAAPYPELSTIHEGLSDVVAIAAGTEHGLALKSNGMVVAWGSNWYGNTNVPPGLTNVVAVAAGRHHSLAIKTDGTVVSWGNNYVGQTNVPSGLSNVVAVAGGDYHSLALRSDGTVVAWGGGWSGQTHVPPELSNVVAVAAGRFHSLALQADGSVVAWGESSSDGMPAGLDDVVSIAAGNGFSLALRPNYSRMPFGLSCSSNGVVSGAPVSAGTNVVTFVVQDDAGHCTNIALTIGIAPNPDSRPVICSNAPPVHACRMYEGGDQLLFCVWATDPENAPLTYNWTWDGMAVGGHDSSYTHTTVWGGIGQHTLRCDVSDGVWSNVVYLQWDVIVEDLPLEVATPSLPSGMEMVPYRANLDATNGVAPYQWNVMSRVVTWDRDHRALTSVPTEISNAVAIAAGAYHGLALKADGTVVMWHEDRYLPFCEPPSGLSNVVAISAGAYYSLALTSDGVVTAWGIDVSPGLSNVVAICGGMYHFLALKSDGTVNAWGDNWHNQSDVPPGLSNVVAVAAGGYFSLALKSDGTVVVWGGDLPWTDNGIADIPDGLTNVVAIACGDTHCLALKSDGTVVMWGYRWWESRFLDRGGVPDGLSNVVAIAAGNDRSLALKSDGSVVSWSYNFPGQDDVWSGVSNVVAIAACDENVVALRSRDTQLPEGLVCSSEGEISGTPSRIGTNMVTFVVQDRDGTSLNRALKMVVGPDPSIWTAILSVSSPFGVSDPPTGAHAYPKGGSITASVTHSPVIQGGTQYVCVGASVMSNDFTQVSPTNIILTLTNQAALTWLWTTNYWLAVAADGAGRVSAASGWQNAGSAVCLLATPATNAQFAGWTGDTNHCLVASNTLFVSMDQARNIVAVFEYLVAPRISVTPVQQTFGSVLVGNTTDLNFTVQNSGGQTLTGAASVQAPFAVVSGGVYSLAAGASQTVTVRYAPVAKGSHRGTVIFTGGAGVIRLITGTAEASVCIAGAVIRSDNKAGLPGATITFSGGAGTARTGAHGVYSMRVRTGWSGTATASYGCGGFAMPTWAYKPVAKPLGMQNYVWTPDPVIEGIVTRYDNRNAATNVTITASNGGGVTRTDAQGRYRLTVPFNWSGVLTPSAGGGSFTPASKKYRQLTRNTRDQNYTYREFIARVVPHAAPLRISVTGASGPAQGFAQWARERGLTGEMDTLFDEDLNGDGISNGAEYAFGENLHKGEPLVRLLTVNAQLTAEVPLQDSATRQDVQETVEFSVDPASGFWFPAVCLPPTAPMPLTKQWFQAGDESAAVDYRVRLQLIR